MCEAIDLTLFLLISTLVILLDSVEILGFRKFGIESYKTTTAPPQRSDFQRAKNHVISGKNIFRLAPDLRARLKRNYKRN